MSVSEGESTLPYSGQWLDRMTARRDDPAWLAGVRAAPEARVIPIWRDNCIIRGTPARAFTLTGTRAQDLLADAAEAVFLGLDGGAGVFAVDLSDLDETAAVSLTGGSGTADVRTVFSEHTAGDAATLAYA